MKWFCHQKFLMPSSSVKFCCLIFQLMFGTKKLLSLPVGELFIPTVNINKIFIEGYCGLTCLYWGEKVLFVFFMKTSAAAVLLPAVWKWKVNKRNNFACLQWGKYGNVSVIYQTHETVFYHTSKHGEESRKCDAQRSVFGKLRGVWKNSKTLLIYLLSWNLT